MEDVHQMSSSQSHRRGPVRTAIALALGVAASALSLYACYGIYDALTGDYRDGELTTVWIITGVAVFLALAFWAATGAVARRGQRHS